MRVPEAGDHPSLGDHLQRRHLVGWMELGVGLVIPCWGNHQPTLREVRPLTLCANCSSE
jgi:hypothetical protein